MTRTNPSLKITAEVSDSSGIVKSAAKARRLQGDARQFYHTKPCATARRSASLEMRPSTALRCGKRPKRAIMR